MAVTVCPKCKGSKFLRVIPWDGDLHKCHVCLGEGVVPFDTEAIPSPFPPSPKTEQLPLFS